MKKNENKLTAAADVACEALTDVVRDESVKTGDRIHAAEILIDRGYGRTEGTSTVVFVGENEI